MCTEPLVNTVATAPITSWGIGATGLWVQLFVFSKFPELLDTMFLVLRKRRVVFLHWYHHVTVLLYCWHSYAVEAPQTLWFVAMNYTVHWVMYGYYCLMALGRRPPWFKPQYVTALQIGQMVIGTGVQVYALRHHMTSEESLMDVFNLIAGSLMYLSYLALFVSFAWERYQAVESKQQ